MGLELNSGSALAVQKGIGQRTGQDVANQAYNANLSAYGYRSQSLLDEAQAANDKQAATIGAVGTLLGTASQVSGKWASYQQSLPPGGG